MAIEMNLFHYNIAVCEFTWLKAKGQKLQSPPQVTQAQTYRHTDRQKGKHSQKDKNRY